MSTSDRYVGPEEKMIEGEYFSAKKYINSFEWYARSHKKVLRVSQEPTMSAGNVLCLGFIMTSLTANVVKGIKIKIHCGNKWHHFRSTNVVTAVTLAY